ncbi:2-C-methyl-D-erythritol 4-phosphate cytidylyltransferase [Babesia ovis]|uniref:2-C-methyl-D-erythritol 4-phosphate cytidylyltransferase n=1 Tax=Babesia ovis TaxID=5869 RepID=A0A9W5T8C0_BABOV|nr:2-C-methyl-D-erythritol 4-phosphate cytidylyltransferase [Babesia ovis]
MSVWLWQCVLHCVLWHLAHAYTGPRAFERYTPLCGNRKVFYPYALNRVYSTPECHFGSAEPLSQPPAKAILLCGGTGERMNKDLERLAGTTKGDITVHHDCPLSKQFVFLHGIPIFVYSFAEFVKSLLVTEVVIGTKPEWNLKVLELLDSHASKVLQRGTSGSNAVITGDLEAYKTHLQKYPYFFYDLEEQRCVLFNSPSWKQALCTAPNSRFKLVSLCVSGDTRAETVHNALNRKTALGVPLLGCCRAEYIALVHDSVRPLLGQVDINNLVYTATAYGSAVPAISVVDTIKVGTSHNGHTVVASTPDRSSLFAIQTPQAFRSSLLKSAYKSCTDSRALTDDSSFVEQLGNHRVRLVPGHRMNIKVTTLEDLSICSVYLKEQYFS